LSGTITWKVVLEVLSIEVGMNILSEPSVR
jgi:hypothetical protein